MLKKYISGKYIVLASLILTASIAYGAGYITRRGDTLQSVATKYGMTVAQLATANPDSQLSTGQNLIVNSIVNPAPTQTPTPIPVPQTGEIRFTAYTTGYGYPDNTPKNSADICCKAIHSSAGGTGTYADPITLAVGHSISGGKDTLDYPVGTRFYIPTLRRYFIVEDACGDGNSPQSGPCHTGYSGHPWLDLWVGGVGFGATGTISCEEVITDLHLVIENPVSTYPVLSGQVYNGSCSQQFGDVI